MTCHQCDRSRPRLLGGLCRYCYGLARAFGGEP